MLLTRGRRPRPGGVVAFFCGRILPSSGGVDDAAGGSIVLLLGGERGSVRGSANVRTARASRRRKRRPRGLLRTFFGDIDGVGLL